MSEPFELLSKEEIGKWLASIEQPGQLRKTRNTVSLYSLANYMGTTRDELHWRAHTPTMTTERQRLFSKIIAQIENGQLVVWKDPITWKKTLRPPEGAPVPLAPKYAADFSGPAPVLKAVPRVKPLAEMPQFGKLTKK